MNGVQRAIFPGLMVGVLLVVLITGLAANPTIVLANSENLPTPAVAMAVPVNRVGAPLPDVVANPAGMNPTLNSSEPTPVFGGQEAVDVAAENAVTEPVFDNTEAVPPVETVVEEAVQAEQPASEEQGCALPGSYSQSVLQWCSIIQSQAEQHGLDPRLLAAVITQESGGNPSAYSHSGAVGLMQVMPRDGIASSFMCINGPCFSDRPSINELSDPEYNISYGSSMLAGLIGKYGNIRDALRWYGPANVGYYYADKVMAIYDSHQ